ncbi:MAG: pitrilysin family protein [bacterium]|nr:pitrilysin family protein [bacterium]
MKYKKTTLPNGVRVIFVPTKGNPSVTTMVIVETGSNYETKEQNGLSHFLEHMCFKGTTTRPTALEIARELDGMGAYNNAFTSHELTGYYAKAEKKHFKKVLELLSDMYLNPVFPKEDLEKERGVILEEISMYEDQPQSQVWVELMKLLYGDVPAGRPVIGPRENIKRFQHKDFVEYRKLHYVAEKTIVVVAGDMSFGSVLSEVRNNFKNIPKDKRALKLVVKEKQDKSGLRIQKKKTSQAHLAFAFRSYDAHDKRLPALNVLTAVLGGGMSGRLWQKMRQELGACYYIYAEHEELTDHGFLAIATGINAVRTEEVIRAILAECLKLAETPVLDEELEKAKEYYLGHLFMGLETTNSLAEFYAMEEVTSGKPKSPLDIEKAVRQVTAKEVMEAAKDLFKNEKLNLAIVGNISNPKAVKKVLTLK